MCSSAASCSGSRPMAPHRGSKVTPSAPIRSRATAVARLNGQEGDTAAGGVFGAGTTTVAGWTVGGGVEAMFNQIWSMKVEYLYMDFGNHAIFNDNVGGVIFPE